MVVKNKLKELIVKAVTDQLGQKIHALKSAIDASRESRDNETKSSVGDKYETARTMMQHEMEKNQVQLKRILDQKAEIEKIDLQQKFEKAEFGSCVKTNSGNYFLSIGYGKVELEGDSWYCISIASPIGKQLFQKTIGDSFEFQNNKSLIVDLF